MKDSPLATMYAFHALFHEGSRVAVDSLCADSPVIAQVASADHAGLALRGAYLQMREDGERVELGAVFFPWAGVLYVRDASVAHALVKQGPDDPVEAVDNWFEENYARIQRKRFLEQL